MAKLKCSDFLPDMILDLGDNLDCQVRQYQDEPRIIYLGQSGNVIQFPESDIERLYGWLKQARNLECNETRNVRLK